jgi:hypothetical protein
MKWLLPFLFLLTSCARPDVTMRAPEKLARALTVVTDLGATATLVKSGGDALDPQELTRGDDGVTFSGFLEATPGTYTLEVVFDGVPATGGDRHFLGRLASDSFTVVQGDAAAPEFTKPLDTVGREGDGGDDDADGLGFLHELLLGADPASDDSDVDGVVDGRDCDPVDAANAFEILDGGAIDDCDADGFRSNDPLLGERGDDCDDENTAVNPGVDDDCTTLLDEDCTPSTCPVDDSEGPTITIVSPADGSTIGCNTAFVVEATDLSDVTSVNMKTPNAPLQGGTQRVVVLIEDDDGHTWRAPNGFGLSGGNLAAGPLDVDVTAFDTPSNQGVAHASYTLVVDFPSVTMTGPDSLSDGPAVDVTVTPSGNRPLTSLELRAAPYNPSTTFVDVDQEQVLAALPPTGGTASVSPDALPGDFVVYPVAVDDIGATASPSPLGASFSPQTGINTGFFCDGVVHSIPAISATRRASSPTATSSSSAPPTTTVGERTPRTSTTRGTSARVPRTCPVLELREERAPLVGPERGGVERERRERERAHLHRELDAEVHRHAEEQVELAEADAIERAAEPACPRPRRRPLPQEHRHHEERPHEFPEPHARRGHLRDGQRPQGDGVDAVPHPHRLVQDVPERARVAAGHPPRRRLHERAAAVHEPDLQNDQDARPARDLAGQATSARVDGERVRAPGEHEEEEDVDEELVVGAARVHVQRRHRAHAEPRHDERRAREQADGAEERARAEDGEEQAHVRRRGAAHEREPRVVDTEAAEATVHERELRGAARLEVHDVREHGGARDDAAERERRRVLAVLDEAQQARAQAHWTTSAPR